MTPLPRPEEMTSLSDREILLLTVQHVHNLSQQVEGLTKEVRDRAPSPREKKSLYAGAVAGAVSLLGFAIDVATGYFGGKSGG